MVFGSSSDSLVELRPLTAEVKRLLQSVWRMKSLMPLQMSGLAVKKREDTHRMAEANKAFSHFKWIISTRIHSVAD